MEVIMYRPLVMDTTSGDYEAPKDPGVQQTHYQTFSEKDFEGHRAHTVYVGVHLPGNKRRPHHRRHKHHHKNGISKDPNASSTEDDDRPRQILVPWRRRMSGITDDGEIFTPPAQRVQFILGEDVDDGMHEPHPLFAEMGELVHDGNEMEWKETARWIKFEEDVEEGGNRWSKPHVATLTLHSLFELRSMLLNGTIMLDMDASSLEQIADLVLDNMVNAESLPFDCREKVREALLRRHRHQHERRKETSTSNMSRLPIIRSLAEIGRNHSSSKTLQDSNRSPQMEQHSVCRSTSCPSSETAHSDVQNNKAPYLTVPVEESSPSAQSTTTIANLSKPTEFGRFLSVPGAGSASTPSTQGMEQSHSTASLSRNLSSGSALGELNGEGIHPKGNTHFMRKIPPGAEASNILVGEVDFLEKPLSAFIRLNHANFLGDLTEVPVPTRFLFILLGPAGGLANFHEVGRAMATLMSDEVFHDVAYKARNRNHLLAAIDEFLDAVTVLPPGEWDPSIRIEPPAAVPSQDQRKRPPEKQKDEPDEEEDEQKLREESGLERSGRLFGGLINDIKRKVPWYWSDFKDALAMQCVASWIFLYFACLSPIITFGGLLGHATGNNMAAMESLVSGFVCGIGYGFFSGQPLTILGSTGPVLVFETIMYEFCKSKEWDYMSFRFWIGMWIALILLILVAIDASVLVCYITRFTEENFATLIAFIFIYKAVENVLDIGKQFPINTHGDAVLNYDCFCTYTNRSSYPENVNWTYLNKEECLLKNGTMMGAGCDTPHYVPDVFLMSFVLFVGTFIISVQLKDFKNALFFPSKVRQFFSDFAVIIAILSMTGLDFYAGIKTPKLQVPNEFKPTLENRGWIISPFNNNPIWTALLAFLPALLGTILIFMDQQISAVIVNRKENKLKKGCGYHLDLFVLAILIIICSAMGLPWFVAATVLSINHVNSLKLESECAAPGEKPQFLGVREQRVTHILIFLMIGLSVVLTPVLGNIPMPVLFGVFLYMGVASLRGLQFVDRLLIIFMPVKYQPDHMFLRQVPLKRVHIFTIIQLTCLVILWVIKSFSTTSILFPLMLVVMIGIRKLLDFVFTRRELKILDDVMPETTKRTEEERRQLAGEEGKADIDPTGNLQIPLANGNIIKIPLASINISEEVNKTGIWKQVNEGGSAYKDDKKKKSPNKNSSKSKKRGNKKDAVSDDEKTRLSTMAEEEEEEGLTIKVGIGTSDSKV
ncbi:sodium-driven chloride bicarbonate exchanger isoform X3 [Zootermopsis nevadensis]|uniref:sodium-driven chloride bicarbonate exchanger isoform X3 n=1 Tax=Zootermopsis nevadensis TaxID=136037 RepID=UPI000B8ED45A|nr:sodium-driven chloride bicarbonate exchanger isoform X3 [Zootermopsis nevadensis]